MTTAFAPTPFPSRVAACKYFCATARGGFQRRERLFFPALARLKVHGPKRKIRRDVALAKLKSFEDRLRTRGIRTLNLIGSTARDESRVMLELFNGQF